MNQTTRDLILLGVAGVIGYFIWKDMNTSTTVATATGSNQGTNQSTPIDALVNSAEGYLNSPVYPGQTETGLDALQSVLGGGGVGSGGGLDSSGGNADDGGWTD